MIVADRPQADTLPVLSVRGLMKSRRDSERSFEVWLPALDLPPGARVALLGESGSGKSTLLSLLALATPPDHAEAFTFAGVDIPTAWAARDQASLARLRAGAIAYLPQRDGLMEFLTLRQNILCSAELGGALPLRDMGPITQMLGLGDLLEARPAALSGGQRQRGAVACALARNPRLILADEPTAALDADNAVRVVDALCRLGSDLGTALVFATHQPQVLAPHGFRVWAATVGEGPDGPLSVFGER